MIEGNGSGDDEAGRRPRRGPPGGWSSVDEWAAFGDFAFGGPEAGNLAFGDLEAGDLAFGGPALSDFTFGESANGVAGTGAGNTGAGFGGRADGESRTRDPWLPLRERFAGAAALDDLPAATGDLSATRGVLARYAVVRLIRDVAAGRMAGDDLDRERDIAAEYIAVVGRARNAERRALGRALARADAPASPGLWAALATAARLAAKRGAGRGAFAFCRTIFELASRASSPVVAVAAAEAVARLAEADGGSERAIRWWRRNAERARREAVPDADATGTHPDRVPTDDAEGYLRGMALNYDADDRARLAEALKRGEEPSCPVCDTVLARREVPPKREVAYVRHRVWLICPECKRSAALDVRRGDARS